MNTQAGSLRHEVIVFLRLSESRPSSETQEGPWGELYLIELAIKEGAVVAGSISPNTTLLITSERTDYAELAELSPSIRVMHERDFVEACLLG